MRLLSGFANVLVAAVVVSAPLAFAQVETGPIESEFPIDDEDPESLIPSAAEAAAKPLQMGYWTMLLDIKADAALQRREPGKAARYYRAMARAVPERAVGFSKACAAHFDAGEIDSALEMCRTALATDGVKVADLALYLRVMLANPKPWTASDVADIDAVLGRLAQHLHENKATELQGADLRCQVAVRLEDVARLRACNDEMARIGPQSAQALVYAFALATQIEDWSQAERLVERAKRMGVAEAAIASMQASIDAHRIQDPSTARATTASPTLAIGIGAGLLLLVVIAWLLLRQRSAAQSAG